MPLDGHAHLISQGWQGQGSGLRDGAIHRPVIVAQKKTLAGIGKDRDEAFPFWDHVFSAAVNSIKIKVYNSDSEDTDTDESNQGVTFQRTRTGIISNRRPVTGTPASHSGTATPSSTGASGSGSSTPRMSIMATAKQEAARRTLYSMFFRGPILGADIIEEMAKVEIKEEVEVQEVKVDAGRDEKGEKKEKKRKRSEVDEAEGSVDTKKGKGKKSTRKGKEVAVATSKVIEEDSTDVDPATKRNKENKKRKKHDQSEVMQEDEEQVDRSKLEKAERKRLRAEKRARKEEKRKRREERKLAKVGPSVDEEQMSTDPTPLVEDEAASLEKKRKKKDRQEKSKKKRKSEDS